MPFIRNLEERFNETIEDLYSAPVKDSADLHPIIYVKPNDPSRRQGTEDSSRLIPIGRVLEDQKRMTRWLTSGTGLLWVGKQILLQTGNAISETRILNPLFINLNLSPNVHVKRQLFDQTDIIVRSPNRSPGSTPDIGMAGRLQTQTGADATQRVMGTQGRISLGSVLGATSLAKTISGVVDAFKGGTYQVNQRPEFDIIDGRQYSEILWSGRSPSDSKQLGFLVDALGAVGLAGSVVGFINPFLNLRGTPGIFEPANFSKSTDDTTAIMPYFNKKRYLNTVPNHKLEVPDSDFLSILGASNISKITLSAIANNLLGGLGFGSLGKFSNKFTPIVPIGFTPGSTTTRGAWFNFALVTAPERTIRRRYETPENSVLSDSSRSNIISTKRALEKLKKAWQNSYATTDFGQGAVIDDDFKAPLKRRGIEGGITLQIAGLDRGDDGLPAIPTTPDKKTGKQVKRYYQDAMNMPGEIARQGGPGGPRPLNYGDKPGDSFSDYVTVSFYDIRNNRLIPFRSIISGIRESVTPEYSSDRYLGRIERNIVYQGVTRNLSFQLMVHAFSPEELLSIWQKVNFLTGLTYPSGVSAEGYLMPPLVELTIGNIYQDQSGWISGLENGIEDDVSWELDKGEQLPHTVTMNVTFEVIEKLARDANSKFYGYATS